MEDTTLNFAGCTFHNELIDPTKTVTLHYFTRTGEPMALILENVPSDPITGYMQAIGIQSQGEGDREVMYSQELQVRNDAINGSEIRLKDRPGEEEDYDLEVDLRNEPGAIIQLELDLRAKRPLPKSSLSKRPLPKSVGAPDQTDVTEVLITVEDLNRIASLDTWINCGNNAVSKVPGATNNDYQFWVFWINNYRFVNRKHHDNDLEQHQTSYTLNHRPTYLRIKSGPTLVATKTEDSGKNVTATIHYNGGGKDQNKTIVRSVTVGSVHSFSVSKSMSINVSAGGSIKYGIANFHVNFSITSTDTNSETYTNNQTSVGSETYTETYPAGKYCKITTTTYNRTQYDYYRVDAAIEGQNGLPSIGIPTGDDGESGVPTYVSFADFGEPISSAVQDYGIYVVTSVTQVTDYDFTVLDAPPPNQQSTLLGPDDIKLDTRMALNANPPPALTV